VKKSKNYVKQSKKVALLNKKKVDIKYDYLHKVSSAIAKNHGLIAIENLKVCNITENPRRKPLS
jgi:putative transposase